MMSCNNVLNAKLEFFNYNMELNTSMMVWFVSSHFCQCKWATIHQVTVNGLCALWFRLSSCSLCDDLLLLKISYLTHSILTIGMCLTVLLPPDCGAGIGRVSRGLLLPLFSQVDLVEQNQSFLDQAKTYLVSTKSLSLNHLLPLFLHLSLHLTIYLPSSFSMMTSFSFLVFLFLHLLFSLFFYSLCISWNFPPFSPLHLSLSLPASPLLLHFDFI